MSDGEKRLVAEIQNELKELVDADQRTNKEIVETALWREFGGERKGVVERRIEEKERRLSMVKSEKNERAREEEEIKNELEALRQKKGAIEDNKGEHREDQLRKLNMVPNDTSHPLVQEVAEDLGITPETALKEAEDL